MRQKQEAIIELLPSRIDLIVRAGRSVVRRRLQVELAGDAAEWLRALGACGPQLKAFVDEAGAGGATCTVLASTPTQAVDLVSLAVRADEAVEAARLDCIDGLPYAASEAVCEACVVARDSARRGHHHVVTVAERIDVAEALATFLHGTGLRFRSLVPMSALVIAQILSRLLHGPAERRSRLYVGESGSFFAVAEGGTLLFARQIGVGLDAIATSLTRPIQRGPGPALTLERTKALSILYEHGLVERETVVDQERDLRGAHIFPLLQPVLQRFVVELRQSLRFGLSAEQREGLRIEVCGPGATIPGLDRLLAEELQVAVSVDEAYRACAWREPGGPGSELSDALGQKRVLQALSLRPPAVSRARNAERLRRLLWTGAGAAVAIIGLDATIFQLRLKELSRQAEAVQTQTSGEQAQRVTNARLIGVISSMNELETAIDKEIGATADFAALMHEISLLTPLTIRLTSITARVDEGQVEGSFSGFAFQDGESSRTALEPFVERLGQSPLFERVTLESVQLGRFDERTGQRFSASFHSPLVPGSAAAAEAPLSTNAQKDAPHP